MILEYLRHGLVIEGDRYVPMLRHFVKESLILEQSLARCENTVTNMKDLLMRFPAS